MPVQKFLIYPKNKEFYLQLIALGKQCLKICNELNICPIVHGSVAYLFYTNDRTIEIRDLDLLIPESAIKLLATEFEAHNIEYKLSEIYPTIKAIDGKAKVSFHSLEYFLKNLSQSAITVDIEGAEFQILNLNALKKGYERSIELEPQKASVYSNKLTKLRNYR